ncbi:MAG: phage tail protein, partial [Helicobacteraceae bacterium]|nr:phage tail protein [Helicobacteraceae bacterium]
MYELVVTNAAIAKLQAAIANGGEVKLASFKVGDGELRPTAETTGLKSEVYSGELNAVESNGALLTIDAEISAIAGGWSVTEIGIFDEDGEPFAFADVPSTYKPSPSEGGVAKTLHIRVKTRIAHAAAISFALDDSVIFATKAWINERVEPLETNIATNARKIAELQGLGGALPAKNFETLAPDAETLTRYAAESIWGAGGIWEWNETDKGESAYEIDGVTHRASEIFNSTWVRNTYEEQNHRFVLTNTPNTDPIVFDWADVGADTVGIANENLAGL